MINHIKKIAVFCGSSHGDNPIYTESAKALAQTLVQNNIGLVYGGGNCGLMGVIADAVLAHNGEAIGVIPESLQERELAHPNLTQLHIVNSMHERKALMADLADAFIILPGSIGTLDEFFEIFTWAQLGFHDKPIGIININDYYQLLLNMLEHCVNEGFLRQAHLSLISVANDAEALLKLLYTQGN